MSPSNNRLESELSIAMAIMAGYEMVGLRSPIRSDSVPETFPVSWSEFRSELLSTSSRSIVSGSLFTPEVKDLKILTIVKSN